MDFHQTWSEPSKQMEEGVDFGCGGSWGAWDVPDPDVGKGITGEQNCTVVELEKGPVEMAEGATSCSEQSHLEQVSQVIFHLGFEHLQAHVQPPSP